MRFKEFLKTNRLILKNIFLVLSIVIGTGIFFKNKLIIAAAHGDTAIIIGGWVVGAIISVSSAVAFSIASIRLRNNDSNLSEFVKKAHGGSVFAKKINAWISVIYFPVYIYVMSIFTGEFLFKLFGAEAGSINHFYLYLFLVGASISIIVSTVVLNWEKISQHFIRATTILKILPFIILIIMALAAIFTNNKHAYWNHHPLTDPKTLQKAVYEKTSGMSAFGVVLWVVPATMFAFDGFIMVTSNKRSTSTRGVSWGIGLGMLLIAFMFIASTVAIVSQGVKDVPDAIIAFFGGSVKDPSTGFLVLYKIISVIIAGSGLGAITGFTLLWKKMILQTADDKKVKEKNKFTAKYMFFSMLFTILPWIIMTIIMKEGNGEKVNPEADDYIDEVSNVVLMVYNLIIALVIISLGLKHYKGKDKYPIWYFIFGPVAALTTLAVVSWKIINEIFIDNIAHFSSPGLFGYDRWFYLIFITILLIQFALSPFIKRIILKVNIRQEIMK